MKKERYPYDAFISHAVEDKIPIANELCERLEKAGLKVWYSGRELNAGDSVRDTIEVGLQLSRFGVIIFSKNYMAKNWPWRELFTLMSREENGYKVILPVLYDITSEELAMEHLDFGDRYGLKVERGLDYVVERLVNVIKTDTSATLQEQEQKRAKGKRKTIGLILGGLILAMAVIFGFLGYQKLYHSGPSDFFVKESIHKHIDEFDGKVQLEHQNVMAVENGRPVGVDMLDSLFLVYQGLSGRYRNEYVLRYGDIVIKSKKRVEATLHTDLDVMVPGNSYGLSESRSFRFTDQVDGSYRSVHYTILNRARVTFEIVKVEDQEPYEYRIVVKNSHVIRSISVVLRFPIKEGIKRHEVELCALPLQETFTFRKEKGEWRLIQVENTGNE